MWDLIVSIPDHSLSFYFKRQNRRFRPIYILFHRFRDSVGLYTSPMTLANRENVEQLLLLGHLIVSWAISIVKADTLMSNEWNIVC